MRTIEYALLFLLAAALFTGVYLIMNAAVLHRSSGVGCKAMRAVARRDKSHSDAWTIPGILQLVKLLSKVVFLDDASKNKLEKKLSRVGLSVSAEEFTARKYLIVIGGCATVVLCALIHFWFGCIICSLLTIYGMMRQNESLTKTIRQKDIEIEAELPLFVRTICQQLRVNRDITAAVTSYRKVAGKELGAELDILLMNIRTGGVSSALQHFRYRIGSDEVYRLCGALTDIERGVDQTATLGFLAEDMSRKAKLNLQKQMSTLPGKMRLTYFPAIVVCIAMIIYVLAAFTVNQLNTLF